jgi:hypothetical protein
MALSLMDIEHLRRLTDSFTGQYRRLISEHPLVQDGKRMERPASVTATMETLNTIIKTLCDLHVLAENFNNTQPWKSHE